MLIEFRNKQDKNSPVSRTYRGGLTYLSLEETESLMLKQTKGKNITVQDITVFQKQYPAGSPAAVTRAGAIKPLRMAVAERVEMLARQVTWKCVERAGEVLQLVKNKENAYSGTWGASKVGKQLVPADRSNIGQPAFIRSIAASKEYLKRERKMENTREFFTVHPEQWTRFLLFHNSYHAVCTLARKWKVKKSHTRGFLASIRKRIDSSLPTELQKEAPLPPLPAKELARACAALRKKIKKQIKKAKKEGWNKRTVANMTTFLNKVERVKKNAKNVADYLNSPETTHCETPLVTGRKAMKKRAHGLVVGKILRRANYRSVLETVYSLAAQRPKHPLAREIGNNGAKQHVRPSILSKPFRGKKYTGHGPGKKEIVAEIKEIERKIAILNQLKSRRTDNADPTLVQRVHDKEMKRLQGDLERAVLELYPPQSIDLVMGSKYVITRQGNAGEMTTQLRKNGVIMIGVPKCSLAGKQKHIRVFFRATRKMKEVLAKGAVLELLRIHPPSGPKRKIVVDAVFKGPPAAFAATRHLKKNSTCPHCGQYLVNSRACTCPGCRRGIMPERPLKGYYPAKIVLGVDVNRPGPYTVAFSSNDPSSAAPTVSKGLERVIKHYNRARENKKQLQAAANRAVKRGDTSRALKINCQLALLHRRITRLRADVHHRCSVETGRELLRTGALALVIEKLTIDPRGTRGALAKAIYGMPDEREVFTRAVRNSNAFYNNQGNKAVKHVARTRYGTVIAKELQLLEKSPRGTSRYHAGCLVHGGSPDNGVLKRSRGHYDITPCSTCGASVNTHVNAAINLEHLTLSSSGIPLSPVPFRHSPAAIKGG
ncbi:MAG: hypothetical protein ACXADA_14780 [Candidatus Hodarchaeales archaeon]